MNRIKMFFAKEWTMEEKVLLSMVTVLGGILIGIFLSPFKSIHCGNNNGNQYLRNAEGGTGVEEE